MKLAKFLKTSFFYRTILVATPELSNQRETSCSHRSGKFESISKMKYISQKYNNNHN